MSVKVSIMTIPGAPLEGTNPLPMFHSKEEVSVSVGEGFPDFLKENLPEAIYKIPDATYLAWVDVSAYLPGEDLSMFFANNAGVLLENPNMDAAGQEFFEYILEVASGNVKTCNEKYGYREISILKDGVTL